MSNLLKKAAAERAVEMVKNGMIVGLGTGSTAAFAVEALGCRVREENLKFVAISTSKATEMQASALGIRLGNLESHPDVDIVIDGADAVDLQSFSLIKGLGSALLREKIVASASQRMVVIVDGSKIVDPFGATTPVPVEVVEYGWTSTMRRLDEFGCSTRLRTGPSDRPELTDGGNLTIDCQSERIVDPAICAAEIESLVGVIESGLFIGMATEIVIADEVGVRIATFPESRSKSQMTSERRTFR